MKDKKLLFLVDDDKLILKFLETGLSSQTLEVKAFQSGYDCLRNLNQNPDMIILDYYFKGDESNTSGADIFHMIRKFNKDIPVIILSGSDEKSLIRDLYSQGISGFILKDAQILQNLRIIISKVFQI